jgi:polyhydroxyalkanoate synthesis regulator protein
MPIQVKKYVNRKLHRTGDTKYLSMLALADLVVEDGDVQVICDRTGRDLTLETLSRALYERLKDYGDESSFLESGSNKPPPFDVSELVRLISLVPARKKD